MIGFIAPLIFSNQNHSRPEVQSGDCFWMIATCLLLFFCLLSISAVIVRRR